MATIALYLRQAMLVAYLALGAILGPWGFALVTDAKLIQVIAAGCLIAVEHNGAGDVVIGFGFCHEPCLGVCRDLTFCMQKRQFS